MTTVVTRGAASAQALGYASSSAEAAFIEDVFSTYLYTGNNTTLPIVNGIDLSTKGGLVWLKARNAAGYVNRLYDTVRGANTTVLFSDQTNGATAATNQINSFNSNGFKFGSNGNTNDSAVNYATWTFRKQPKFFDVVTYTGTGANRTVAHALGSVPGCIMVKRTDTSADWQVYHRSLASTQYMVLNDTAAVATGATRWNSTTPTDTVFSLGTEATVNASGGTYVAYLFAHNAGGFGLTGTDNVISCGSYAGTGSNVFVNLGYEPQWVMIKNITTTLAGHDWIVADNMRGIPMSGDTPLLYANLSSAENGNQGNGIQLNATGFTVTSPYSALNTSGSNYIYIAIRRGPMKVPTSGTQVYNAIVRNGTAADATVTGVGFPVDLTYTSLRPAGTHNPVLSDRLRGAKVTLSSRGTQAEQSEPTALTSFASMDGVSFGADNTGFWNGFNSESGLSYVNWFFRRAPGFFDEVCYTGVASPYIVTNNHNLTTTPEMIIGKIRNLSDSWFVYHQALGASSSLTLNSTSAAVSSSNFGNTAPTATQFTTAVGGSAQTLVAYLFATVAGVSKVGSYTGTGTTQVINCGFTAGARFVLIKRTDSTGDWYVWDSARGIIAGNDPYLLLNSTAAEVTSTDYVDTASSGFEISSTAPAAINANGGSFIFLAIA